jgi:O-antigen ligase
VTSALRASLPPLAVLAAMVGLAQATILEPRLAAVVVAAFLVGVVAALSVHLVPWYLIASLYAGAVLLGYGFANVGLPAELPIPLAEGALVCLLVYAAVTLPRPSQLPAPFTFAALFVALATVRLAVDLRHWGEDAIRDYTLAIELGFLFVGYWAFREYGLERWIKTLRWIFLALLPAAALYPLRDHVADVGPVVGLRRSVPLFGDYSGAGVAAISAFFFFSFLRPFGRWSPLLAAGCLPAIALFQSRGLYVALPATALLVWLLVRDRAKARLGASLTAPIAAGALALALIFVTAPEGRLARVSPDAIESQLRTLVGGRDEQSTRVEQRLTWVRGVLDEVGQTPNGWVVGVGLGPDLAGGFEYFGGVPVRKPHNDYIEVLGRLGIPGVALLAAIFVSAFALLSRAARRLEGVGERFLWWVLASTAGYLLIAATQPILSFPYATIPLFTTLGAGLALAVETRRDGARSP